MVHHYVMLRRQDGSLVFAGNNQEGMTTPAGAYTRSRPSPQAVHSARPTYLPTYPSDPVSLTMVSYHE